MPKLHTASELVKSFKARFAQPGTVDLAASGKKSDPIAVFPVDPSTVNSIEAAGVRSFTSPGKQTFVKVLSHFLVLGETVSPGEYVELPENEAKQVERSGVAAFASDEEVAAASKPAKAGK